MVADKRKKKKHECHLCEKSYTSKHNLDLHMRTQHSNKRPYKCNDCEKNFKDPTVFKRHRELHELNGERNFECNICKSKFITKSRLSTHIRFKHKDKLYSCPKCGNKVKGKITLDRHIRKHFDSYKCSIRGK